MVKACTSTSIQLCPHSPGCSAIAYDHVRVGQIMCQHLHGLLCDPRPDCNLTQLSTHPMLTGFRRVASQHDKVFAEDRTSNLIVRLRHNVIRAGLRRISLAYSRISLADVASKLGLANVEDTECIVAKAIR